MMKNAQYQIIEEKMSISPKAKAVWNNDKENLQPDCKKGKTYEEYYGIERTKEIKQKISKNNAHYWLGKTRSEEVRKKMSESAKGQVSWIKGKHHTEETKRKIGLSNKYKVRSTEAIRRMSLAHQGYKVTEETKRKQSKRFSGEGNPFYGKKLSEEHRRKISLALKGKKISKENLEKLRLANVGRPLSEEHKKKIGNANRGDKGSNWKGGISFEPYGREFNEFLKKQIRRRDQFRCQQCFRHQNELKRRLSVHHIDFNKQNNSHNNLISLCMVCHSQTNYKRHEWTNYFQNKIQEGGLNAFD